MLNVQNLGFRVGDFELRNVCLHVKPREYFVLMGATGSGKSLLVKSVCGLVRAETGRIMIGGDDVTDLPPRLRGVGYVPQESCLMPHLNVLRNVTFALEVAGMSKKDAAEEIAHVVESLGIRALLDRSTVNLSGGERQKVALARALAHKPKLLLLDEPVSALDEPTRREICAVLGRVQKEFGVATIHVCHSRQEAEAVSDRVGVMSHGKLVQAGPLDELTDDPADQAVRRLLCPPADETIE
ncbi:MAG: ATP-binding cassette domain-containing protein [Phycisphaerae bacterium]|jgi:ABC-type sugar transport system ATPase subunit|nr:ATP-binding cassette domain-containing protein [Phycisphaerae bacterium]